MTPSTSTPWCSLARCQDTCFASRDGAVAIRRTRDARRAQAMQESAWHGTLCCRVARIGQSARRCSLCTDAGAARACVGVDLAADSFGVGSAPALDLRREDVLSLWRAGAGADPGSAPRAGRRCRRRRSAGERRKVVTVVFADVVGSTALGERVDPETLRWAMQRWFGRMRDVDRAPRRDGRELHRRRGDGGLRHPGRARGRRAARRARGGGDARGGRGVCAASCAASAASSSRCASASTPGEAVTGRRRGRRARSPPATSSTSPRGSSRRRGPATSCSGATRSAWSVTRWTPSRSPR